MLLREPSNVEPPVTAQEIRSLCIERHQRLEDVRKLFAGRGVSQEAQAVRLLVTRRIP